MNQTQLSTFQLTFMQKLLGRNYKWWYLFIFGIKSGTAYNLSNLFWIIAEMVTVLGGILVWFVNKNEVYNTNEVLSYFIIGQMFLLGNHAITQRMVGDISSGKITSKLLLPSNIFLQYLIRDFGYSLYSRIVSFGVYSLIALIFSQYLLLPKDIYGIVNFYLSILISFWILSFVELTLGSLTFFTPEVWSLVDSIRAIARFGSGNILPLNILKFLTPLIFLPFAFTFYHPMQIYLGKYYTNQTILVFLGGIAWCAVLYFLANFVFKLGLKRNESVGL